MAAFRTGDTLVFPLGPLLDAGNNPLTGKASFWTALTARKPDGTTFTPVYTELSNGSYLATVTSDQRGAWFLVSRYRETGQDDYVDATTISVDDGLAGNVAVTTAPIALNGAITLFKRNDYAASETRSLDWTTTDAGTWPDLTGASIAFASKPISATGGAGISAAGAVITPSGATKAVRVEIAESATAAIATDTHDYQVRATLANGHVITLAAGKLRITPYIPAV